MKHPKQLLLISALVMATTAHMSGVVPANISTNWTGSQVIPDNNASGVAFTFNLSGLGPVFITDVKVDLNIAGGWNGDLFAYLSHGSGYSVLLNRPGSTSGNPGGSGVSGLNVEFSDSYLIDVHTALNSPLTGNFAPDGRTSNPFGALDTDPRTAMLGSFNGIDPNGSWTLFFADVSPLSTSTVQSWTVNVGFAVPEPGSAALVGLALALGFLRRAVGRH